LWEAFLLQMNDFDRFLEHNLRRMLDPVVEAHPPARGQRAGRKPVLAVNPPAIEPAAEPVPVTVSVTPLA
jgi:hypothetical protein